MSQKRRPFFREFTPPLEQVRAPVGGLHRSEFTWASPSSHTSRRASEHSDAQSRKLDRNPCGTAPIPTSRTIFEIVASESARPRTEGNTRSEPSATLRASRRSRLHAPLSHCPLTHYRQLRESLYHVPYHSCRTRSAGSRTRHDRATRHGSRAVPGERTLHPPRMRGAVAALRVRRSRLLPGFFPKKTGIARQIGRRRPVGSGSRDAASVREAFLHICGIA